jgi:hypothetical protein
MPGVVTTADWWASGIDKKRLYLSAVLLSRLPFRFSILYHYSANNADRQHNEAITTNIIANIVVKDTITIILLSAT